MKYLRSFHIASIVLILFSALISGNCQDQDEVMINIIFDYESKAFDFQDQEKDLDSAEFYYSKALELQITNFGAKTEKTARILVNLASVYKRKYDYKTSFECSNQAEEILKEIDPESIYLGYIYHNIGNYYYVNQDFVETKRYYEYAIDWFKKLNYVRNADFYKAFGNYIDLLFYFNETELAENLLNQNDIEKLASDNQTLLDYRILYGKTFYRLNQPLKALEFLDEARSLLKNDQFKYSAYYNTYFYVNSINTYISLNDFESAEREVRDAIRTFDRIPDNSINTRSKKAKIYYLYSYIKLRQNEHERALEIADIGLDIFEDSFIDKDDISKQKISNSFDALSDLLHIKSEIYYFLYQKSKDTDLLHQSYSSYLEIIELLNRQKLAMQNEGSKFIATENVFEIYQEAINIARILYNETSDIEHLETSFRFAESSKSFALLSEIKKMEAIQFAGLPSEIKEEDERLTREIQAYEEILYEQESKIDQDSAIIANTKDKIFHLRNSYNELLQNIEHNYANYYNLKYDPHFASIREVQSKLSKDETLVEYVLLDTALITFVIGQDRVETITQKIDEDFSKECFHYYTVINQQDFSRNAHQTYRDYLTLSRKFYKILIEPVRQISDSKNLIIIPDGPIMYLPFEAFVTEDADLENINYRDLSYLIYDISIGYSHSSTLLYSERYKSKAPEMKVLAFAPHYEEMLGEIDTLEWNRQGNPDFLLPLPGVIREVEKIELMVPSKAFYREFASETNFKENASDYNILHLAMHTRMDDNDPMMSNLVFSQTDDTLNDGRLYAYEIYNLQLNAQMAVLSSCASGFGNMLKGEGMMSLARGFMYAGCPSIIMTLWQVSDNSSADLMTSFYKYLRKGKSKQEALRLAKIKYLDTADDLKSNPYFWSGFVCIGDTSPIYRKSAMYYWGIIVFGFILIILGAQYYSGKKSQKGRRKSN